MNQPMGLSLVLVLTVVVVAWLGGVVMGGTEVEVRGRGVDLVFVGLPLGLRVVGLVLFLRPVVKGRFVDFLSDERGSMTISEQA